MLNAIRQWVIKTMMKNNTGVVQTLPKRDLIELNTQITAQRLMQNGIEPNSLKNVNQVENAVNAIDNRPPVQQGIKSTKSAKVMDMEGKEIKDPKNIMGGKEINQQTLNEELMKTDNPYSDLVNTPRPKTLAEREAEILARMEKENKEAAQRIRDRKADEKQFNKDVEEAGGMEEFLNKNPIDDDTGDFAQGGRAGFKAGLSKALLEFMKKFKVKQSGDDVKDFLSKRQFMKDMVGNTKENEKAMNLYKIKKSTDEYMKRYKGYQFPSDEQIKIDLEKRIQPILNKGRKLNATGGRIGLKAGMTKRAFLKLIGGTGAAIGALKSGIFSGFGKGAGKQVAKEVVQKSTSTPPAYFFELAEKIKTLGRVTDGPQERIKIHSMPAKDGKSELMLTEDIGTGEMQIKKIGKEEDMTTKVETMEYTPGSSQADETTQGIPADSYDEYTEVNSRIYKDEFNEPDIIDGIEVDEIIEEVKDQAPSIKKAGGGIARMLGE